MPKYIVTQGPVEHDGKLYLDGDELSCKAEAGQPLVEARVVVPQGRPAQTPPSDSQESA